MDGHFSDFIVIGGGMAGLACASELARSGASAGSSLTVMVMAMPLIR